MFGRPLRLGRLGHWVAQLTLLLAVLASVLALLPRSAAARADVRPSVVILELHGPIDPATVPLVHRSIRSAEENGAKALVLDIDTLGGRVDSVIAVRDALLASPVRTVAFVHPRAISAGALIALASTTVAMADGGTMGAAMPVTAMSTSVDEKTISFVRAEFRATAEERGRRGDVAEAMVDAEVEISGVVARGSILTLTTPQALALGVADVRANDVGEVLAALDLEGAEVLHVAPAIVERLTSLLTRPVASSILIMLGLLGLMIELRAPGFGLPGLVGAASLALFFGAHLIARLVGFEEVALVSVGVVLLLLEVFVLPGFGIAGVLGIVTLLAGLTMSLLGAGYTAAAVAVAAGHVLAALAAALIAFVALGAALRRSPLAHRMVLSATLVGVASKADARWLGVQGYALTPLRPAGTALLAGVRVDVVADGDFVPAGTAVEVTAHEGHRVVVHRRTASEASSTSDRRTV